MDVTIHMSETVCKGFQGGAIVLGVLFLLLASRCLMTYLKRGGATKP